MYGSYVKVQCLLKKEKKKDSSQIEFLDEALCISFHTIVG